MIPSIAVLGVRPIGRSHAAILHGAPGLRLFAGSVPVAEAASRAWALASGRWETIE